MPKETKKIKGTARFYDDEMSIFFALQERSWQRKNKPFSVGFSDRKMSISCIWNASITIVLSLSIIVSVQDLFQLFAFLLTNRTEVSALPNLQFGSIEYWDL